MEFKAEVINGKVNIKAITERKKNGSLVVHVPSFPLINEITKEYGKRNIQQVQGKPNE